MRGIQSDSYKLEHKLKEEVIDDNITLSTKFELEAQNDFKTLPIIYRLAKLDKNPTGARFIVASRKCNTKTSSKTATKTFELIFKQIQSFHEKSQFNSD